MYGPRCLAALVWRLTDAVVLLAGVVGDVVTYGVVLLDGAELRPVCRRCVRQQGGAGLRRTVRLAWGRFAICKRRARLVGAGKVEGWDVVSRQARVGHLGLRLLVANRKDRDGVAHRHGVALQEQRLGVANLRHRVGDARPHVVRRRARVATLDPRRLKACVLRLGPTRLPLRLHTRCVAKVTLTVLKARTTAMALRPLPHDVDVVGPQGLREPTCKS